MSRGYHSKTFKSKSDFDDFLETIDMSNTEIISVTPCPNNIYTVRDDPDTWSTQIDYIIFCVWIKK